MHGASGAPQGLEHTAPRGAQRLEPLSTAVRVQEQNHRVSVVNLFYQNQICSTGSSHEALKLFFAAHPMLGSGKQCEEEISGDCQ